MDYTEIKINILGTEWNVLYHTIEENESFASCDGYCDPSAKKIHFRKYTETEDFRGYENRELLQKKTLRHEIIHAFMFESGLWRNTGDVETWAMNEEMVDWIAIQMPKMVKAMQDAGAM